MHVARVLDCAVVEVALQQVAHLTAVEQADFVAEAATHGFLVIIAQTGHVARLVSRVQMTVFEVALNAVLLDPLPDDLMPAPAQVPDEIVDFIAEFRRICLRIAPSPERLPVTCPPLRPVAPQPILWLSTMATFRPFSASSTAVATPVKPPPMITTST